jgi:hypothetical protein
MTATPDPRALLARSLDQTESIIGKVQPDALAFARRALPPEDRGGDVPFGAVVAVPDGEGPYARLAGWLGRSV